MAEYEDKYWSSEDGLKLHYRDYAGDAGKPPIVCLPGLTRNARDFEGVAERLSGKRRVLCVEFRGRGLSEYANDSDTYNPMQYAADVEALCETEAMGPFVAVGTSLGGLVTSLLAARGKAQIAGALINDIGPVIDQGGVERIKDYVGHGRSFPTWMHAARALQDQQGAMFPQFELSDWLDFAKKAMTVGSNGRIVLDYDMRIAEPFNKPGGEDGGADLWPAFKSLSGGPVVLLRGAKSDLLSQETAEQMAKQIDRLELVIVPGVGHAPTLDEPEAIAAMERLLERVG